MGSTFYHVNGKINRKAEIDKLYTWEEKNHKVSVVKSVMKGAIYYGAIKVEDTAEDGTKTETITATVVKTMTDAKSYYNFGYKGISETSGPGYYDCPASILDILSPIDSEWANEWRNKCRAHIEEMKSKPALKDLPYGAKIQFFFGEQEYILEKKAPNYQFKNAWWYKADTNTYMPRNRIPDSYKVVQTA